MSRSDSWDTTGWDEKVDGMENKEEYHWLNDNDSGKPAPLPIRPSNIAHGTAWERTCASMVRRRRLTVSDGAAEPVAVSVDD
jgi:hypothetical protein